METFAAELIARLAATSVQTALLVTLVWALCRALPRLPAATQCWLWWTVALQAVLGLVAAPLEVPLLPALPAADTAPVFVASAAAAPNAVASLPAVAAAPAVSWQLVVLALWLAGVLLMSLRTALAWRASRALVDASKPCADAVLVGALRLAAEAHGLRHVPALRVSRQITSPQLVGILRPALLLPAHTVSTINDDDLDMALTHELVHLRRRDLWWGLLPALAQHVAFFHPLVHLAVREYSVAREAAVDAAVVAGNRHCRSDYGRLLVRLGVTARPGAGLASASPSFLSLKRRLLMLQNTSSFPRLGAALILATVAVAGVTPLRLVAASPAPAAQAETPAPKPVVVDAPSAMPAPPAVPAEPALPPPPATKLKRVPPPPPAPPAPPPPPPAAPAPPATSITGLHIPAKGSNTVWFERGGAQYVIKDPATVERLRALHEPSARLGEQQGELGRQQVALGRQQGELGKQMAVLSSEISRQASEQARIALAAHRGTGQDQALAMKAAEAAEAATERATEALERSGVTARIEALAQKQAELGLRQANLGEQQADLTARAAKDAEALIDRAVRNGLAQRIDG